MTNRFEIDPRLKKIADHYGFDAQAEKAIKETPTDVFIIMFVVILNAVLGVIQESKAEKAIEEMAELIVAIKHLKKLDGNEADYLVYFVEELADVKIMIDQLCYLNDKGMPDDCDLKTEPEIEFKIDRQLKRIAEEELSK